MTSEPIEVAAREMVDAAHMLADLDATAMEADPAHHERFVARDRLERGLTELLAAREQLSAPISSSAGGDASSTAHANAALALARSARSALESGERARESSVTTYERARTLALAAIEGGEARLAALGQRTQTDEQAACHLTAARALVADADGIAETDALSAAATAYQAHREAADAWRDPDDQATGPRVAADDTMSAAELNAVGLTTELALDIARGVILGGRR